MRQNNSKAKSDKDIMGKKHRLTSHMNYRNKILHKILVRMLMFWWWYEAGASKNTAQIFTVFRLRFS